ncbi:hypothetical protein Tco_0323325 [Tanacetum coccineum]
MSLSHVTISSDPDAKSVGSSTSLVILSDTRATVVAIPTISPKIAPEAQPSPDYVPALPDYVPESDPEEDPLEDDSPSDDATKTTGLEEIPFSPPYRIHPNGAAIPLWIAAPLPLSPGSSSDYSSSLSGSSSFAPLSPYSEPSHRRSHYVSSSETSHLSSSLPPRKMRRVLAYSSSSASLLPSPLVGPSCKRRRSPTPPLPAAAVSTPYIEMLPPCQRFMGTSSAPREDVHSETTVETRLDDHSEMIREMYEHLLDIPSTRLDDTKHELETLRARVVSSEREIDSLLAKARVVEQRDEIARDRISELEDRLGYAEY